LAAGGGSWLRLMHAVGSSTGIDSLVVVVAGALCVGMSGCCAFGLEALLGRASNEFACPRERIEVIRRNDIGPGTYDLDACGSKARYTCISADDTYPPDVRCVREPDPSRWDPDPALLPSLPRPPGMSGDGRQAWICYQGEKQTDNCLVREAGGWRWNYHQPPKLSGGGLGVRGE
jgi:hypothetical protein